MAADATDQDLPAVLGRHIVIDERGVGLRATWRPAHGFINVSLWRDDRCVETFHLTPKAASELVAFIAQGLAASVPAPSRPSLRVVPASERRTGRGRPAVRDVAALATRRVADVLDAAASRLRRSG